MKDNNYGLNWNTPVLILNCKIGALSIMRTLGKLGVPVYGIDENSNRPELKSKYLKGYFVKAFIESEQQDYLNFVLSLVPEIGQKIILIPTSDELSLFVAKYRKELSQHFLFPDNSENLMNQLADKVEMFALATRHHVPRPHMTHPQNLDEVKEALTEFTFPIMLKGIDGNRLLERTGKKMLVVHNEKQLFEAYKALEDPEQPNLMLQEMIPGDDDQVFIFNGYFDKDSNCKAAFTGHKLRQHPIHVGCASLGITRWNEQVAKKTIQLMKDVNYKGILDIGYRLDPRDGRYKVLDINPRVGQAFRLFTAENDMDVIRTLYLDLTEQEIPEIKPVEERRWLIEDYDFISSFRYYQEGSLKFIPWVKSFKNVQEAAWFSWKDPLPFITRFFHFISRGFKWLVRTLFRDVNKKS